MAIQELSVFPQWTRSAAQGLVGTRKWVVTGGKAQLQTFLKKVCASQWPGEDNAVPVLLQVGAFDEKLNFCGGGGDLTELPHYKQTLVVAQYQYLFFQGGWPSYIKDKPFHPEGTTLALRVRGSGQFLTMPPGAFTYEGTGKQIATAPNENCRIIIPLTEYHLTCDRMTDEQVPSDLKKREGTVNVSTYLGEKPDTLLFDTWELDPSFAVATGAEKIARHKLTVCLRCREVEIDQPNFPAGNTGEGKTYAGWNFDYHQDRWVKVFVKEGRTFKSVRYRSKDFATIFGRA